jgi:tetratricopeptide (TPR) repeat protein
MTARHALGVALVLVLACKKPADVPVDAHAPPVAPPTDASPSLDAKVDGPLAESLDAARAPALGKARTQEEVFDEAAERVRAAEEAARGKKPDCDKIAELLDVAFATVGPEMSAEDRPVFATFAACAMKAHRWRLLRAVANAIALGDAAQKTTYYLPRALLGLAQYDAASRLSSMALRLWPKEGEAYTTGALASARVEDWEACSKEADQALLVQRQKGLSDEISAEAHILKGEALLHQNKLDLSSKEFDLAMKINASDLVAKLRDRNDVVKSSGLLVEADLPDEIPLGIYPLFVKSLPLTGSVVTLRLSNTTNKPISVRVEATLAAVAEPVGKMVTVGGGRRETLHLAPPLRVDFKPDAEGEMKHDLAYKVSSQDGQVLYGETRSVAVLPPDELPLELQLHQIDNKLTPELAAAWITPAAKSVVALLDAAKRRAPGGQFAGREGQTLQQVKALWDELRERGFAFVRDPSVDSEASRCHPARLPGAVILARGGNALEGSLLFASLLEAIGLDVVVVRVPGHVLVGWLPSKPDHAAADAMSVAVQSPAGSAFFLETTMVSEGPGDAAVLRGDAEFVDVVTKKVLEDGRGSFLRLAALRKLGIAPRSE